MSDYPFLEAGPKFDDAGVRVRRGGCSCGAVRFELRGEPEVVGICHCLECRKATGAVAMVYARWSRPAFRCTGDAREYRGRSFCTNCGSRLFHPHSSSVDILLGALDDAPSDLTPTAEGWTQRREAWWIPVAGAEQATEDPSRP